MNSYWSALKQKSCTALSHFIYSFYNALAMCHICILNLMLSALFSFFLSGWVSKRLPLYEGTGYILLKKHTYTD